jgi:hypothetical protein
MVDALVHIVRLSRRQHLLVILDESPGVRLPDKLAVLFPLDVFAGKVTNGLVAPQIAQLFVLDPAEEGNVLKDFEVVQPHSEAPLGLVVERTELLRRR